ncbi:hypothetical protein [Niveibacterium sp. SC-1]|uniref:hypothetical protein n=1 Tax=Niveibacterium sp. SC-1 TaxID=3135646 RepID=UPI00311FB6CF
MRLIVILLVVAIVGVLAAKALKTETASVGDAARKAGVEVPQGATPHQQVEAVGKAVEKAQSEAVEAQRKQLDEAGQ